MGKNQYKTRTITCKGCGKVLTKRMPKGRGYCSLKCWRISKRPQNKKGKNIICLICKKEVYKKRCYLDRKNFCSLKCANEYQGRNKIKFICKICKKEFRWSKSRVNRANPKFCSIICRNKDKRHLYNVSTKGNLAQFNKNGFNKLELKGNEILNNLGIKYQTQVCLFNKFIVDILIKNKKLIIQWDGEYWHNKPKRKLLDFSQDKYLKKCGYAILRVTDKEIKEDVENVYKRILLFVGIKAEARLKPYLEASKQEKLF